MQYFLFLYLPQLLGMEWYGSCVRGTLLHASEWDLQKEEMQYVLRNEKLCHTGLAGLEFRIK